MRVEYDKEEKKLSDSGGKKICLLCGDEELTKSGSNLLVTAKQFRYQTYKKRHPRRNPERS